MRNSTLNTVLKYIIYTGVFAVPFIPFIVTPTMLFPFITGKNFTFRIIVEIIAAAWVVLAVLDVKYRPRFSWILGSILAFTGIMLIADVSGMNVVKSFWSNCERMEGWVTIVHLAAYFVVLSSVMLSGKFWRAWFNTSLGVSVIISLYAFGQLHTALTAGTGIRLDVFLGNAAYLAVYTIFHIFIALYLAIKKDTNVWLRVIYGVVIIMNMVVLFYTATRGAILGVIGGVFVASVLMALFAKDRPKMRKGAAIGIIAVVVLVAGFFAVRNVSWVKNNAVLGRFTSISMNDNTTKSRFMIWNMAFQGFKEKPVLGWGQEGFNYVFNKYYDPGMYEQEQWFDRTHNVFFDWLIAGGLLGLLSYLSIIFFTLWYLWKSGDKFSIESKTILTGLIAAHFFHNMFVFDNLISYIFFFTIVAFIHSAEVEGKEVVYTKDLNTEAMVTTVGPIVLILLCVSIYFVNVKPMLAASKLIDALNAFGASSQLSQTNPQSSEKYAQQSLTLFTEAVGYGTFVNPEIREQLMQIGPQAFSVASLSEETKQAFGKLAVDEMQKQTLDTPLDARYQLFMGSLLSRFGQSATAITYLEKARELSPRKQTMLFQVGAGYIALKQYDKAFDLFKHTYELDPNFDTAAQMYAVSSVYVGKETEVCKAIGNICSTLLKSDAVLKAYVELGAHAKSVAIVKDRISANSKDPQNYISLAIIYFKMGNRSGAVAQFELAKSVTTDAQIKNGLDRYIKEIQAGRNPGI
ncbi:MAG: O-antigen ligase family protein [Candidatus Paceibacterota bacterium]|jgi:O-antigen ligase